jgi:myosin heavy subunit
MNNRGYIEVLLLLCCLVGAVTFVSLAFCIVRLHDQVEPPSPAEHSAARNSDELKEEIDRLRKVIEQKEKELAEKRPVVAPEELESKSRELKRRIEELEQQLRELEAERARLQALAAASGSPVDSSELAKLESQIVDLEKRILELKTQFEALNAKSLAPADLEKEIQELKRRLEETKKKRAVAEQDKDKRRFTPESLPAGLLRYRKPLFVECKKSALVIHPGGQTVKMENVSNSDVFTTRQSRHDLIVLLVRPDGFQTFYDVLGKAKETKLPTAYEPIEADILLDLGGSHS